MRGHTTISVEQMNIAKLKAETPCLAMRPHAAALALGISERLLEEWRRKGLVPYIKVGGVILFPLDSLRDWLRKQAEGDEKKPKKVPDINSGSAVMGIMQTIYEQLRKAIQSSEKTRYKLWQETDIDQGQLARFMAGTPA
jgi:hypothetical protein